jgi:hypothetical protein
MEAGCVEQAGASQRDSVGTLLASVRQASRKGRIR